jgi:hypothetical protein
MARPIITKEEKKEKENLLKNGKKKCSRCNNLFLLEDFEIHDYKKGTLKAQCKECFKILRKERYQKDINNRRIKNKASYNRHKEARIAEVKKYYQANKNNPEFKLKCYKRTRRKQIENAKEFYEYKKTLKCSNCPENHPACLDFHHLDPNEKEFLITKLIQSKKKLKEELKKCIVLCANCHRKFHFEQRGNKNVRYKTKDIIRNTI